MSQGSTERSVGQSCVTFQTFCKDFNEINQNSISMIPLNSSYTQVFNSLSGTAVASLAYHNLAAAFEGPPDNFQPDGFLYNSCPPGDLMVLYHKARMT